VMDPDVIFNGEAGHRWLNRTGRVAWQFHCDLVRTCGRCLQFHLAISSAGWPIPLHANCRCRSRLVAPGDFAPEPFLDFRELLSKMPRSDQAAAIGASNYRLLRRGLVKWEQIVTPYRVRSFREVMILGEVGAKAAIDAGIRPGLVEAALASGALSEAELDRARRLELVESLRSVRVSQDALVAALERGMKAATAFAGGVGVQSAPTAIAALPHAAELAAELAKWRPARRRLKAKL
jgi:hypothetical protein